MVDLILPVEDLKNKILKEAKNTKLFIKEFNNPKLAVWRHLCIQAPSDIVPASPHLPCPSHPMSTGECSSSY